MVGGHHFDSPSDLARQTAFRIYYTGDKQQEMILSSLVETRHQLATLCGYETFAHRAVSSSLAQTPENINMFLSSLAAQMEPRLKAEYLTMTEMKEKSCTSGRPLAVWDLVNLSFWLFFFTNCFDFQSYLSSIAKHNWFSMDLETVSEYFSLGTVMEVD